MSFIFSQIEKIIEEQAEIIRSGNELILSNLKDYHNTNCESADKKCESFFIKTMLSAISNRFNSERQH